MHPTILYEDNHVIAVQKPHGMLVQADDSGDGTLINEVRYFIKQRDDKPGNVFLGLIHRLDRPVGGVVIFAKTSKGASRLCEQFRAHGVDKIYWAIVEGHLDGTGIVKRWLVKNEEQNVVKAFDHDVPGSQSAETSWKVLRHLPDGLTLVELTPKTGRSHQLRVAMSSLGFPILGDVKYGASSGIALGNGSTGLALMARSLSFDQPVTKERITAIAEPDPKVFHLT